MGRKGNKIIHRGNSHITVNLVFSEHGKGSPDPSFICLVYTLQAGDQKLCLLLLAPAVEEQGPH